MINEPKTITNDIAQSRKLVVVAAILYAAWGLLHYVAFGTDIQVLWEMIGTGMLMCLTLPLSYFSTAEPEKKILLTKIGRWILVTHYFTLVARSNLSLQYAVSAIFLVFMTSSLFQSRRSFAAFGAYTVILSYLCGHGHKDYPAYIFASGIASCLLIAYIALTSRLTLIDSIKNREILFRSMFQNSFMGMVAIDIQGKISMMNDTMLQLLGTTYDQTIGHKSSDWVHPDDFFTHELKMREFLDGTSEHLNHEFRFLSKDKKVIWVKVSGNMILTKNLPPFAFMVYDNITQKIEAETIIKTQQQKMVYASKMTALGEMSGSLAHEINTPLAVIMMTAHNLKKFKERGILTDDFMNEAFDILSTTVERISKIILALRKFSRDSSKAENEVVSLMDVINDSLSLSRETFASSYIELQIDPIPKDLMINCRPIELSQVLINLLNNAKDSIKNREHKWVKIGIKETSLHTILEVVDSGPSIPQDIQAKIFQPFFTTKPVGQGTGLGLSISIGIIQSFGGVLEYDSKSPNCKFDIKLPKVMERDKIIA